MSDFNLTNSKITSINSERAQYFNTTNLDKTSRVKNVLINMTDFTSSNAAPA